MAKAPKYTILISDEYGEACNEVTVEMNKHQAQFADAYAAITAMEILEETIEEQNDLNLNGVVGATLLRDGVTVGEYRQLNLGVLNISHHEAVTNALAHTLRTLGLEDEPDAISYVKDALALIQEENETAEADGVRTLGTEPA